MNNAPVVVAQLGCGYWGPNLLRNFSNANNCHVKYVIEHALDRRQFVSVNYPAVQVLDDMTVPLMDPEVHAVIIATPARTHFPLAKAALQHGKHVFVEKPLAMTVAEVDELDALAQAQKRTLMVGHTFLYNPAVEYLRMLVETGELGQVYYAYAQRMNLGVVRTDINAMWNLAPHDVSILACVLGVNPLRVSASGSAFLQPGIEDFVFMGLEFPGQVRATIQVSWLDPSKVRRITVVGSKKKVVYDDVAEDKITIYDNGTDLLNDKDKLPFDAPPPFKLAYRAGDILIPKIRFQEPLKKEAAHFIHCILSGKPPLTGAANGRMVVATLAAAQKSLENSNHFVSIDQ